MDVGKSDGRKGLGQYARFLPGHDIRAGEVAEEKIIRRPKQKYRGTTLIFAVVSIAATMSSRARFAAAAFMSVSDFPYRATMPLVRHAKASRARQPCPLNGSRRRCLATIRCCRLASAFW